MADRRTDRHTDRREVDRTRTRARARERAGGKQNKRGNNWLFRKRRGPIHLWSIFRLRWRPFSDTAARQSTCSLHFDKFKTTKSSLYVFLYKKKCFCDSGSGWICFLKAVIFIFFPFFFSSFLRNDYKEFLYSYLMENMKRTKYVILHYKRQMRKSFNVENEVT